MQRQSCIPMCFCAGIPKELVERGRIISDALETKSSSHASFKLLEPLEEDGKKEVDLMEREEQILKTLEHFDVSKRDDIALEAFLSVCGN